MEKIQVKIRHIFEKREGESERGRWAYQDIHVVEDNNERYPNEFLATCGLAEIETLAKLKEGDTIKLGLSFGVRSYTDKEEKIRYNQSVSGWGIEVVELSSL
jgi:hypothetical protein